MDKKEELMPTEVNGVRRVAVKKASLFHRLPGDVLKFLNENSVDNFLHAEFKLTRSGKHVITLRSADDRED